MRFLPVHIRLENKSLLFVGGGKVNERRIKQLEGSACNIIVISPTLTDYLKKLYYNGRIEWIASEFDLDLIKDKSKISMAFVAVDSDPFDIVNSLKECGIMVECASNPDIADFIFPAILCEDEVLVSISTQARDPALSKKLKRLISTVIRHAKYSLK